MVPDLTLEVIYLDQPTDFKMEFELCSNSNVRFLSLPVKNRDEFLSAISKSVIRSRAIITVGSFNPLDKLYIPKIIAKATGYNLKEVEKEKFGIESNEPILLPASSLPLVDEKGNLCGSVLENNDQSIIMLTSDRELRHGIVTNLVCPYLKLFANKSTKSAGVVAANPNTETIENNLQASAPIVEEQITAENTEKAFELEIPGGQPFVPQPVEGMVEQVDSQTKPLQPEQVENNNENIEPPKYVILEQPETGLSQNFDLEGLLIDDDSETRKPKKGKTLIKIIISIILVIAVLLGSYFGYDLIFQPMQRASVYEEIRNLYGQKWNKLPEDMLYKFGKLYQTNPDIYGWISIPNTNINLPVVSSASKSSAYYSSHLFEGSVNRYGTLYTPAKTIKDGYHRNVVIYGKDTNDDSMFSELEKFLDIEQYKITPTFTFDTVYVENTWKIFSVFKIKANDKTPYFDAKFLDDDEFSNHLMLLKNASVIDTNIDLAYDDQIVTLVSQGEDSKVVLAARRVRSGESPMVDVTGAGENNDADDFSDNSSDIPVIKPLESVGESSEISEESDFVDSNILDGASSRYEQQAPVTSIVLTVPNLSSSSSIIQGSSNKVSNTTSVRSSSTVSSSSSKTSSKNTTSKTTTSKATSSKQSTTTTSDSSKTESQMLTLTVTNTLTGTRVTGNAVDIVAQNIQAEMGEGYHIEALKAQAVAAYSWLLKNGSASGKAPRLPLKTPSAKCLQAAEAVAGQVAVYNGEVATTFYFAISAGRTAESKDIWEGSIPYCKSVDSSVDKSVSGFETVRKYSADTVADIAKDLLKINLNSIKDKNKWFSCTYDANGLYCSTIKIGSVSKKGPYMRDTFFTAARVGASNVLRSSAYTIEYDEKTDMFIFTVKGYGHGVGMSQAGANVYAKKGWNYEKILKHYYTGITLGTY